MRFYKTLAICVPVTNPCGTRLRGGLPATVADRHCKGFRQTLHQIQADLATILGRPGGAGDFWGLHCGRFFIGCGRAGMRNRLRMFFSAERTFFMGRGRVRISTRLRAPLRPGGPGGIPISPLRAPWTPVTPLKRPLSGASRPPGVGPPPWACARFARGGDGDGQSAYRFHVLCAGING